MQFATPAQWILGFLLVLASLGVILARKPVHSSLSFFLTLMILAAIYLELSAQFIAVMQILVYAGAILVIFMFVIVLFQDAHEHIDRYRAQTKPFLIISASVAFVLTLIVLGSKLLVIPPANSEAAADFGSVESLGKLLYLDFFFPFEAVVLLFLIAIVGSLYIARKLSRQEKRAHFDKTQISQQPE
ncbi:MAG: NADH-quinone oxidoreductase subunit J [Parachlamydiaceae bacterium]|nr:NADH-quinone oxidoreductase subunit J [Parachlamydiaceae bacterium]